MEPRLCDVVPGAQCLKIQPLRDRLLNNLIGRRRNSRRRRRREHQMYVRGKTELLIEVRPGGNEVPFGYSSLVAGIEQSLAPRIEVCTGNITASRGPAAGLKETLGGFRALASDCQLIRKCQYANAK